MQEAASAAMVLAESRKGMEDLEDAMGLGDEVDTKGTQYWWNDKYRCAVVSCCWLLLSKLPASLLTPV